MARRAHRRSQSLRIPAGPSIPALGRLRAVRGLTRCVVLALALCALALCALALAALFATPTMAQDGTPQPTACAGPDLTGAPGETVTLQGRCSTNPYGKWYRMAHAWKQLSGTEVTLSDASRGDPSFTIPSDAANGAKLEFRLTVTDQEGQTDSDTVVVTVDSTPEPTPPTACAGPDLTGEPGEVVRLEGICSVNPHGQWWRMGHLWTQPEGQNIVLSNATRGRPTFTVPADAARGTVYTFTLTVTDKDGESDSDSMTVTVPAAVVEPPVAENHAPAFGEGSETSRSLPENSPAGTNVGAAVTATDPDDDRLTYELSGKDAGAFDIDIDDDGQLTTIEGVTYDYETKSSYSLSVSASDGNGGTASIAVTVSLANVNEAPIFDEGSSATREVAENSGAGVNVGDAIAVTDPEGDSLTYSLSGTDAASFAINAKTGQLQTKSSVTYDHETKSSYSLTVDANDGNGGTASIGVTVKLTNVNEAPAFNDGSSATRSIAENTEAGASVGAAIAATDPEGDRLTYSLSGTDASSFGIDSETGQITTIEGVTYDFETKVSYSLSVSARDGNGGTASIAVTVKLTDVDETPPNSVPSFDDGSSTTRSIAENSPGGTNVGAAITASDPDDDKLTYSLSGTDVASFTIDTEAGQLQTKSGVTYDFEAKSSYSLTVSVRDGNGGTASIAVTVKLTDVNEVPVFGEGNETSRSLPENSAAGTSVGAAITATDPDDDKLTYALSGDDAGAFAIDDDDQLTTIEGVTYDYETQATYSLTVTASDPSGASASIAVTVKLTDVEEPSPVAGVDYDADADDLIEVTSLAQLRAVFFDLNGDGAPEPADAAEYQAAYSDALPGMGCRIACAGYELAANLDFDSNGSGESDSGDAYWNGGAGWDPIGGGAVAYTGKFHGNGHTISNLYINRSGAAVGLFGRLGGSAYIHHVGLLDAGVTNAAQNAAGQTDTGALVGEIKSGAVVAASYATGSVSGGSQTGGLAGDNMGRIVAVWTEAAVSGTDTVGGIVGDNAGAVVASYAIGLATGGDSERTKGVAGRTHSGGSVSNSYYNSDANPPAASGDPGGKTSVQLLEPTGYTGIYAGWNVDLDGDGAADDPWDFGGSGDYPLLKADRNGDGAFTWREFGSPEQPDFSVEGQTGDAPVLKVVVEKYSFLKNALGQELWNAYEPGARIFLRASTRGSTVPQGTPLTYAWEQVSGPDVTLNNTASSVANYVVPIEDPIWTTREFRLTVTGGGLTASYTKRSTTERYEPLGLAGLDSVTAPATTTVLQGSGTSFYVRPARLSHFWRQVSGPTVTWGRTDTTNVNNRRASFTVPADTPEGTVLTLRLSVTDPGGLSDYNFFHPRNHVDIAVRAPEVGSVTPATGCFIYLGELTAQLQYVGAWNDHSCSAHHSSGLARYFNFTLSQETQVSVRLSQGTLFISTGTPVRGWGSPPAKSVTHEDRNAKRMANGKLVHYGSNSATKTLSAGEYTVEASGWGVFNIIIKPGAAPTSSGSPPAANAGRDLSGGRGDTVTLRGTGSINPHGSWAQLQHQWAQLSGPTVTLTHPQTARYRQPASKFGDPRFVVPGTFADGTKLVFKLTVTDKDGETDSDTTTVTVSGN